MDLQSLSTEDLQSHIADKRAAYSAALAGSVTTLAEVEAIEAIGNELVEAEQVLADREALATRTAALHTRFATEAEVVEEPEVEAEVVEPEVEVVEVVAEAAAVVEPAAVETQPVVAANRAAALAGKVVRPAAPETARAKSSIVITAAAEVPNFASGAEIDLRGAGFALIERLKAFGTPSGSGGERGPKYRPDHKRAGVARFAQVFPKDLQIHRGNANEHMAILAAAADETSLPGGSLTAAGGWCSPSENLYDLCEGETLDGLISVPEVQVDRGGINFSKGPDFAAMLADPNIRFLQTEAQAEAGEEKDCFEVPCPPFTDIRLDAEGLCLMIPILTEAAWPELVDRVMRGALVAYAHKRSGDIISRMVTSAGAALTATDFTTTAHTTLANLELIADLKRQHYRLGLDETLEVVAPFWAKGAIRNDFAIRTGRPMDAITDEFIAREFATRNLSVQWVYNWQPLPDPLTAAVYPGTFNVLMYPAGTFVVGTSDVINLNAVYDHASLVVNTYTGLFFEEGLLVANRCFDADLVTIPVCNSGHTGAVTVDECHLAATP